MSTENVAIAAIRENAPPWAFGFHFFDEKDWPQPGFRLVKRITGTTAAELYADRRS